MEADHGLASGARTGVGDDLEGPGGEFDPVVVGREERGQEDEKEQPPHAFLLSRAWAVAAWGGFGTIE